MFSNTFETILLVAINAFSAFLIIIVLANSFTERLYRWFVVLTIFLLGWVNFAYIGYSVNNQDTALLAYRLNLTFVSLFFFAMYMFYIDCFLQVKRKYLRTSIFIASVIFAFLSLFTDTIIQSVVPRGWGNEIIFGSLNDLFNVYSLLITGILMYYFVVKYFKLPRNQRRKVAFFLIGTFFLVALNVIFNVLSPALLGTAQYQHLGDYSAVIFLGFTALAMIQRKFLDVKVALTAFLITVIGILLLVDLLLLSDNSGEQVIKMIMFTFFVIVSVILVRSVLQETRQKEKLEKVNRELESTTESLAIELKHTEELKNKIEEAYNKERDMMDILGHELRTPLTVARNAILMMDNELQKPDPNMATIKDYIEKSKENIRREIKTLQTVLSTTRLENNRSQINFEKVDLRDVVNDSLEAFGLDAVEKGLEVNLVMPPEGDLDVWGGREQVQEIMDNLLSNAVKYTAKGRIRVMVERDEEFLKMSVADTGEGIPEEEVKNLGKKFHRVNPYVDNHSDGANLSVVRPGGTGIGLYVVTGFLNAMGGRLEVQSELGKGSNFIAVMPVYNGQDSLRKQIQQTVSQN